MTQEQANEFLVDYGPVIWFVFLTVVFLAAVVKAWPFIASVVFAYRLNPVSIDKFLGFH